MKSITVISGKGGTGKTILAASFAVLADSKVMADCDVDAADLHLLLKPEIQREEIFEGGQTAQIDQANCVECGECIAVCRFDAISDDFVVDPISCEGCALCCNICPEGVIEMEPSMAGRWYISNTRHGPMVHARLGIADENSGKLVALVRQQARLIAERDKLKYVIVDGPPGIGCPVISSITGTDLVVVVTEPTISGLHDLQRVISLATHFGVRSLVCVNKYDLNIEFTDQIRSYCDSVSSTFLGHIPFDTIVTEAMVNGKAVVEYSRNGGVSEEIRRIWTQVDAIARQM